MPALPDREFSLPRAPRAPRWLWPAAVALHVPVVLLLISERRPQPAASGDMHIIALGDSVLAVRMVYAHDRSPLGAPVLALKPPRSRATLAMVVPVLMPRMLAPPTPVRVVAPLTVDSPPGAAPPGLRPQYGNGRLWVQPLPESPRKIASTLTGKTPAQLTDSAVGAMVQTYLDEMAKEKATMSSALPSWTTTIGGKTVGIDQKWIYLGPLKIPTALLALLPIRVQPNLSEYEFNQRLEQMRLDLFEAARRSATLDDFREAVKDLHAQKEREREFQKNQRTPPDTSHHG